MGNGLLWNILKWRKFHTTKNPFIILLCRPSYLPSTNFYFAKNHCCKIWLKLIFLRFLFQIVLDRHIVNKMNWNEYFILFDRVRSRWNQPFYIHMDHYEEMDVVVCYMLNIWRWRAVYIRWLVEFHFLNNCF